MITLPTHHTEKWLNTPSENPPQPLCELKSFWLVPGFKLRIIEYPRQLNTSVLFFTDLHWPPHDRKLYAILSLVINALDVDWLLFGGDLATYMDALPEALRWLKSLQARCGKLATRGNRESAITWKSNQQWQDLFSSANFNLLINSQYAADTIRFYAPDDARYGSPLWNLQPDSPRFTLTFAHSPDTFADAPDGTYMGDLGFCGHTHGGQFRLPLIGPLYTSSKYGRQFLHHWQIRKDGFPLFISSGIGEAGQGLLKHRLCCSRDMLFIRL